MFYPASKTDWLPAEKTRTLLFRRVRVPFLTLGHLRSLEVLENALVSSGGKKIQEIDLAQAVAAALVPWRTFRREITAVSRALARRTRKCTPRNGDEVKRAFAWFSTQFNFPSKLHQTEQERKGEEMAVALGEDYASTPCMRYAVSVCQVDGWQSICGTDCVWDLTLPQVRHLILAKNEVAGMHHIPRDMVEEARHGCKG